MRRRGGLPPDPEEAAALEVEHHLAERVDRLVETGLTREAALAEARQRFGDVDGYRGTLQRTEKQRRRMMRRIEAWDLLTGAVVQVVRTVRRSPGFAAGVVLALALGVGANAAMFGILDRLLFRPPMHVVDHERVVRVMVERPFLGRIMRRLPAISFPDYLDLKAHNGFASVAALTRSEEQTLGSGTEATRIRVIQASHELFPLLGARPALGRFYGPEDDRIGAAPTAVVSHEFWRRALGSERAALGRTLEIEGSLYTVVGVAPAGFTGVDLSPVDVWLPIETSQAILEGGTAWRDNRFWIWMEAVARLAPGVEVGAAAVQAEAIYRNGHRGDVDAGETPADVTLDPLIVARGPKASAESRLARWLGGVSLVVLLIACANVANLLLAQATRRRREVAVRLALGTRRARLVAQSVLESVLLSVLAGGVALVGAAWGGEAIRAVVLPAVYFPGPAVSGRVLSFTLLIAVLAGGLAAVGPALQGTRADLVRNLSMGAGTSSARRSRVRALLTVAQTALSVVLLVGAGLFVKSVSEVRRLDLGLDVDRLLLARLELESDDLAAGERTDLSEAQRRNRIYLAAMEGLSPLPGVEAVAATASPFGSVYSTPLKVPGLDSIPRLPGGASDFNDVTPGYLETVGLRVVAGRTLRASDGASAPKVTVVSETTARALWPGEDPLGKVVLVGDEEAFTVVGVVQDAARQGLRVEPFTAFYLPITQRPERDLKGLYIRWSGRKAELSELTTAVSSALRSAGPDVRYATVRPLREILDPQARSWTLGATLFTVFGMLALVVAAVGLYSVLAFDVAQRTRELGIRSALGAEKAKLLGAVVASGVRLAAAGVAIGLGVALVAAPYVKELLFDVSPRDPAVLVGVALTLLATAFVASLSPALRATRVDPMVALRSE